MGILDFLFGRSPTHRTVPEALSVRLEVDGTTVASAQLDHIAGVLQSPYRMVYDVATSAELPIKLVFYNRRSGEVVSDNEIPAEVGQTVDIYGKPGDRCFFWG